MAFFWQKSIAGRLSFAIAWTIVAAFALVGVLIYGYMARQTVEHIRQETLLRT